MRPNEIKYLIARYLLLSESRIIVSGHPDRRFPLFQRALKTVDAGRHVILLFPAVRVNPEVPVLRNTFLPQILPEAGVSVSNSLFTLD